MISEIVIMQSNGQVVKRLENVAAGSTFLDLSDWAGGFYLIRFKKDKSVASGKLVVLRL
ncbi:MAG TPA: T9SS type A sorting domain-containing protein [Phaeodactylibacter sp.]|nr:T9SS type A sorting domain-containing protein [Phaeodactylibacter sp.]